MIYIFMFGNIMQICKDFFTRSTVTWWRICWIWGRFSPQKPQVCGFRSPKKSSGICDIQTTKSEGFDDFSTEFTGVLIFKRSLNFNKKFQKKIKIKHWVFYNCRASYGRSHLFYCIKIMIQNSLHHNSQRKIWRIQEIRRKFGNFFFLFLSNTCIIYIPPFALNMLVGLGL